MKKRSSDITLVPISNFISPKDGIHDIHINWWWIVTQNDEIVFYGSSPQCNMNEELCILINKQIYSKSDYKVVQITIVYLEVDINDYI